jgi:hypothetical protein
MVTASVATIAMKGRASGRKYNLSLHFAGNEAIGAYIKADWNAPAAATSPDFFTVPEVVDILDLTIPAATTGGACEFTSDGQRTQTGFTITNFYSSVVSKPVGQLPALGPGKAYRLLVVDTVTS